MHFTRPEPVCDADTLPFWNAARAHRLDIQRCLSCGRSVFYPRAICPHCHGGQLEWITSGGTGTIYSYTVARRPAGQAFAELVPYVIVLVDLDDGVRMLSNLITPNTESVHIGDRVRVVFVDLSSEISLPMFEVTSSVH